MFWFSIKDEFNLTDIIIESIGLFAVVVLLIYIYKLYRAYGKEKNWVIALTGVFLYLTGTLLDLLDEILEFPKFVRDIFENGFITLGMLLFSIGIVIIVRHLINMAIFDPLTGLYHKNHFIKLMNQEIERSRRYNYPFSILFIDLDNFKEVNDRMGHMIGDVVLRNVSAKIKEKVRTIDVLGRYGGDEFILLMPQTGVVGAEEVLSRLKEEVAVMDYPGGNKIGLSGGIAVFPYDGTNAIQLVNLADNRMYSNKSSGTSSRK